MILVFVEICVRNFFICGDFLYLCKLNCAYRCAPEWLLEAIWLGINLLCAIKLFLTN